MKIISKNITFKINIKHFYYYFCTSNIHKKQRVFDNEEEKKTATTINKIYSKGTI